MFTHVVMFKMKNKEDATFVSERLKSMEGQISYLKGLEVGVDVLDTQRSFEVTLITRFDSLEDMEKYQVSDYHQNEVLSKIKPMVEKSVACDFES